MGGLKMQNRRTFIRKIALGTTGLMVAPTFSTFAAKGKTKLTILHTNDMHCHLESFTGGRYDGKGGLTNLCRMVDKIRKQEDNVLLLDAGDMFQGTPYFNFYKGELMIKLMSEVGYDAGTIGNHEFDNGLEGIANVLPKAKFPIVNANYDFSETILRDTFKPYTIVNKAGLKVGIYGIGIELHGLVAPTNYGKTHFENPVSAALDIEAELKEEGCDLIICLSHLGHKYKGDDISDYTLAGATKNTDLIIGGHTHTFLKEPVALSNKEGKQVLVGQAGWGALMLGRIDLWFD
jgi:5'-nucleotidase